MVNFKPSQDEIGDPILTKAIEQDTTPWYKKPNLRTLYILLFPTCIGIEITSGFDSQLINAAQFVEEWQTYFGDPGDHYLINGLIAAAYNMGAIVSVPFIPWFANRFGRRWSIFVGSLIMVIGAGIQAAAQNRAMYIIARGILGFGIAPCIVSGSALIGELAYPKERPIMTSLFNTCYHIGSITAAGIFFGTIQMSPSNWSWRLPSLLQALPSILQLIFIFFIPESPRYLITKDRREEAFDVLVKYHAEGDRDSVIVAAEFAQIETTLKIETENAKRSWKDILASVGNQKRFLIGSLLGLFTQWSGNTLISYYLGDILEMAGYTDALFKSKLNCGLTIWNLINATTFALVVKKFARRKMYMATACSLLLCYIGWTIAMRYAVIGNVSAGKLVIFFIFLYSPCYNLGYNALTYTFLVELFPYTIRSRGITVFQFWGRGAGCFSTFVNPIGFGNVTWKYLLSYVCFLAFEVVAIYFLWPETKGRTLEELTFLFEPKELRDKQEQVTEKNLHGGPEFEQIPMQGMNKDGGTATAVETVEENKL